MVKLSFMSHWRLLCPARIPSGWKMDLIIKPECCFERNSQARERVDRMGTGVPWATCRLSTSTFLRNPGHDFIGNFVRRCECVTFRLTRSPFVDSSKAHADPAFGSTKSRTSQNAVRSAFMKNAGLAVAVTSASHPSLSSSLLYFTQRGWSFLGHRCAKVCIAGHSTAV